MRNLIALSFLLLTLFACKTKEKDTKEETVTTEKSPTEIGEVHISTQSMEFLLQIPFTPVGTRLSMKINRQKYILF